MGLQWLFWPALVVLGLNIENLAISYGLDKVLVGNPIVADVFATLRSFWFQLPAAMLVGAWLALWIDAHLRREEAAKAIADLYAEGVANRNRLRSPFPNFDEQRERDLLDEWGAVVLERLTEVGVKIGPRSNFRTLNLYNAVFQNAPGKTPSQNHLESMWTEKLRRLREIIDSL
jgi:hypothetical protein